MPYMCCDAALTDVVLQVMDPDMFNNYRNYEFGYSDVIESFTDGRTIIKTRNVLQSVQV